MRSWANLSRSLSNLSRIERSKSCTITFLYNKQNPSKSQFPFCHCSQISTMEFCGLCRDTHDAARSGHLECLKSIVKNGCPWHPETTWAAASNGHKKILEYIFVECADFVNLENLESKMENFDKEIQDYIKENRWLLERQKNIKGSE